MLERSRAGRLLLGRPDVRAPLRRADSVESEACSLSIHAPGGRKQTGKLKSCRQGKTDEGLNRLSESWGDGYRCGERGGRDEGGRGPSFRSAEEQQSEVKEITLAEKRQLA